MQNLYTTSTGNMANQARLAAGEKFSIIYHNLFDFPLNFSEIIKWSSHRSFCDYGGKVVKVAHKNGFYYLEGREGLIYKRTLRKRISAKKLEIAKKASRLLSFLPGIKMVAVTGSLAMQNSTDESDIDLMIITKKGVLWTTRLFAYVVIHAFGFSARKPNDLHQRDKLCLNMWLDESDLVWQKKDRNIYTAHEIGQILPLVNKDKTFEKFLFENKWILDFWPNSVRISNFESGIWSEKTKFNILDSIFLVIEKICYWVQIQYMRPKMTREVATATRALFHPQDWGKVVLRRLSS